MLLVVRNASVDGESFMIGEFHMTFMVPVIVGNNCSMVIDRISQMSQLQERMCMDRESAPAQKGPHYEFVSYSITMHIKLES